MQQYRIGAAVHGGGGIAAVRNGSGAVEVFSVGTDGTIWNFYPDSTSDTGYSSMSTGMVGSTVTAGVDSSGRIVLFAGNNLVLNYVQETGGTGANRWGPVQQAQLPMPVSPIAVSQIYTGSIGGVLYVGVLTRMKSVFPGNTYAFAYSIWDQAPGTFTYTTMTLSTLNCLWSGNAASTAEFTCLDQTYIGYEVATGTVTHYTMPAAFSSLGVATVVKGDQNQYFAILNDGNLYTLIGGGQKPHSWAQVTQGMSFRNVGAALDMAGNVQLFCLSTDARVYHVTTDTSGRWTNPAPIHTGAALMGVATNDGGNIEVFLVGTAQGALTRMIQDEETGGWQATSIEVPTLGQVEEYVSYSTDVTVNDAAGVTLPGAGVQVRASAQTQITVNGATYIVDPNTPANLTANAAGRLSITQQTSSLGIPTLEISVTGQSPSGQSTAVRQFAGVQDQLANVTSDELMGAKDASGSFILQDQYRNPNTTAPLAQAFNECMKLADSTAIPLDHSAFPAHARKLGVGLCARDSVADLNRIQAPPGFSPWQLDFSSGTPVFRILSADESHGLLLAKRAQHQSVEGILDWVGSIGDVVAGIVDGIVDIVDTVISVVGDAINAAITFVVDGVTYLFNTVVHFVEQAFDIVEAIFAKVKVFFEKVFEWLGFLFAWNDILRTHRAFAYTINQFLGFLQGAPAGIQSFVDSGIAIVQNQVDAIFDQLVGLVGGGSVGGYTQQNTPSEPAFTSAGSNNIVLNATVDNIGASSSITPLAAGLTGSNPFDPIITQLQQLVQTVENLPQWQEALDYMTNLGGGPDQIFQQILSALLRIVQGIIKAILAGLQAVADALLQLLGSFVAQLQAMLNEEWNIPFVSEFYSWLTDSELTTLDLVALMLAIPSTILYKAMNSAAPFPDDASVTAFEASFSAQTMLANSGLGPKTALSRSGSDAAPQVTDVSGGTLILSIGGTFATCIFGFLSAGLDVTPADGTGVVNPIVKKWTVVTLIVEATAQGLAFPWFNTTSAPNCSDKEGATQVTWLCETVGVLLDVGFWWKDQAFPEDNNTNLGVGIAFLYGCAHCITVGVVGKHMSGWGLASKIVWLIPELAKPLRLTTVIAATKGFSLPGMAALDCLGFLASGICSFVDTLSSTHLAEQRALIRIPGAVPHHLSPA
jgi:hypothetical protein